MQILHYTIQRVEVINFDFKIAQIIILGYEENDNEKYTFKKASVIYHSKPMNIPSDAVVIDPKTFWDFVSDNEKDYLKQNLVKCIFK